MKSQSNQNRLSSEQAEKLMEQYFNAETSLAEECALRDFVCTEAGMDTHFDELRAVLALSQYGKHRTRARFSFSFAKVSKWAAAVIIFCTFGSITYSYRHNNSCIAYVGGKKVTDSEYVLLSMQQALATMGEPTGEPTIEQQLNDMFQ